MKLWSWQLLPAVWGAGLAPAPARAAPGFLGAGAGASDDGWSALPLAAAAAGVGLLAGGARGRRQRGRRQREQREPTGVLGGPRGDIGVFGVCAVSGRPVDLAVAATPVRRLATRRRLVINGFGRIGRVVLRCMLGREESNVEVVGINIGSMKPSEAAHLLKYDSVFGTLGVEVVGDDAASTLTVGDKVLHTCSQRDPRQAPWREWGVDIVVEATGSMNSKEGAEPHLEAGAKKVVITAPAKDCPMFVCGVNEDEYDGATQHVISNASCTTNGLAPVVKVLDDWFGVVKGTMTTVHSYTSDQKLLDGRHKDLRRARAAALSIVPTSTGAAKAVGAVMPHMEGKLDGYALRVPTPNVSLIDLVVEVNRPTSSAEVNGALAAAAQAEFQGIIRVTHTPLVSTDYVGAAESTVVDAPLTNVVGGNLVHVAMWYDNEWGYSQRVLDLVDRVAGGL